MVLFIKSVSHISSGSSGEEGNEKGLTVSPIGLWLFACSWKCLFLVGFLSKNLCFHFFVCVFCFKWWFLAWRVASSLLVPSWISCQCLMLESKSDSIWLSAWQLYSEEWSGFLHFRKLNTLLFFTPLVKDFLYSCHNAEDSRVAQERLLCDFQDLLNSSSIYSVMILPMRKGEQPLC